MTLSFQEYIVKEAKELGLNGVFLWEIVDLRLRGYNYSETAERMGISRETVAKYLRILQRLNNNARGRYLNLMLHVFAMLKGKYMESKPSGRSPDCLVEIEK